MKLDREQADIVMTALQNHRAELYIDGSQSEKMEKVSKIILTIEEEMEAKRLDQQKIMINEQKYGTTFGRFMQQFFRLPTDKAVSLYDRAQLQEERKRIISQTLGE